jgi:polyphosphate kinase 2
MKASIKQITVDGKDYDVDELIEEYHRLNRMDEILCESDTAALQEAHNTEQLKPFQAELIQLQEHLEKEKRRMIILFEGRDAAGKGGAIRRVTRYMNPKHYRVVALGKPTEEEKSQWYYQKYIAHFPRGGEIVLFDRSWYNRAMVERVFGFCTDKEYTDFMNGVGWLERDLVTQGTILVKLYFSVTMEEQARRFDARINDPLRQWKFSEIDRQAHDHWEDFTQVKYEMLKMTHTYAAPWTVIRSDDKHRARLNAIKTILNSVSFEKLNPNLDFHPDPDIVVSGAREIELMDAELARTGRRTF